MYSLGIKHYDIFVPHLNVIFKNITDSHTINFISKTENTTSLNILANILLFILVTFHSILCIENLYYVLHLENPHI